MTSDGAPPWHEHMLYDLADYINGRVTKPGELVPDGVPVIKIAELNRGITAATDRVPAESVQERHWVADGDLLFAWSGSVGIHIYRGPPAALNQHIFRVTAKPDLCDQRYLRYLLIAQLPAFERFVASKRTTMGHVTVADLRTLKVRVPSEAEQERIVTVLGALDDKIDHNRRLLALLDEVAASIFRVLFVDKVNVSGNGEVSPATTWKTGSLTDVARFVNGKAFTKEANDRGRPILRIKELNDGVRPDTPRTDIDVAGDHLARHHDILFAWSGSLAVYRWSGPESVINQHIFKVIPDHYAPWFVYQWIRRHMPEFQAIARDKATTMGHIQRHHLHEAVVPLPDAETLTRAGDLFDPLDEWQGVLNAEVASLIDVRDALLPKLVSGAIRVSHTTDVGEVSAPVADEFGAAVQ
jgi:type I restriction enzyme, S subunit